MANTLDVHTNISTNQDKGRPEECTLIPECSDKLVNKLEQNTDKVNKLEQNTDRSKICV